jgi:DNA-binding NarL/FixJ family response regulator
MRAPDVLDPVPIQDNSRTVVVAEDNGLLRDGLVAMLERFGFKVVGAVTDAEQLQTLVEDRRPALVITDVRMPPGFRDEGLRAAVHLRRHHPELAIVVLSQYVEHSHTQELLADDNGRFGYLLKDRVADVRSLISSLEQILAGGTVIDPEVVRQLLARRADPLARLTSRERETLALMAEGRSNAAIAAQLVVTEATVAKHIRNVLDKLDLPETPEDHRRVRAVITYLRGTDER